MLQGINVLYRDCTTVAGLQGYMMTLLVNGQSQTVTGKDM
jgi:hypothetical protein